MADGEKKEKPAHRLNADHQADDDSGLRELVRYRVYGLSKLCDHVEMPGDKTVGKIGQAGKQHNKGGKIIIPSLFRVNIGNHKYRDQQNPEIA